MVEDLVSLRAVVRGRVQGVGFRDFVYTRSRFLGLTGYVRNSEDGQTLEVVAEGPQEALEQLIEYLWEGPRSARVEGIDVAWGKASGHFSHFGVAD